MKIVNHGKWSMYTPENPHPHAPANTLYSRNEAGEDWYSFKNKGPLKKDSVKAMAYEQDGKLVIGVATKDQSRLFPGNGTLIEIIDPPKGNPLDNFAGKVYDPKENKIDAGH